MPAGQVAAAIIGGGSARRMGGIDKGGLEVGGRTILERQLEVLCPLFDRVFMVASNAPPGIAVVPDRGPPGRGPLAGIDAALAALLPHERAVVCVAGDMPLLVPAVLELLRDTAPDASAVVPRVDGLPQPLLARFGRACATAVAAALAANALKAAAVLNLLPVHWLEEPALRHLDPTLRSLENANTPEDLTRIRALATIT